MKKVLFSLVLGTMAMTASAQQAYVGNKFTDNWSLGVVGGGITKTTHSAFWGGMRATYGLEATKQVTPVLGFGLQLLANNNTTPSKTAIDQLNLSLLGKVNLSNLICGYQGSPRFFEVEAAIGAGWGHDFYVGPYDKNYLTSKYGLNFNFNLGESKAWTISFKPSIVYNMAAENSSSVNSYNVNNSAIELLAGVTYHFKTSNGKRYLTGMRAYDQAEVDALTAKINDLRNDVNSKQSTISSKDAEIANLKKQLKECQDQKATAVQTVVESTTEKLESVVTFGQGKTTVDNSQLPNVERIATYMKNHKNSTVDIKGYASPEGSVEVNTRIAKARAEAVKTLLVNKYKISSDRITAEGQGVGNMFSEPDWNRVSISTINESK